MNNETVDILKEQIAELRHLVALKDQRISELLSRTSYPYQPTYPTYPSPLLPYNPWGTIITSTTSGGITMGKNTIGYCAPTAQQPYPFKN